ncbi:hypothetical protein D4Z78_22365 [Okeania hirsuta]|nr:hypothetical protein D4Z78_22365 [Okeania hirsuta]
MLTSAETIPEVGELNQLETFVGKKIKSGTGAAVDHFPAGILGWVVGNHSAETFMVLWQTISWWKCYIKSG